MSTIEGKRIVVVEDDPLFLSHVSTLLTRDAAMRVAEASSSAEAFEALSARNVECVVLDYDLGNETGLALGQRIRIEMSDPPPIVMLTGEGGERTAIKAFRLGFTDYVSKRNFNPTELFEAIHSAIERHEQERALRMETERLRQAQSRDILTGLPTQSYIQSRFEELVADGEPVGVIVVQIEGVADLRNQGQRLFDQVYRKIAFRLEEVLRRDDVIGRLGTDRFVCLTQGGAFGARHVGQRLAAKFSFSEEIARVRDNIQMLTGAVLCPDNGANFASLIDTASSVIDALEEGQVAGTAYKSSQANESGTDSSGEPEEFANLPPGHDERRARPRYRVLKGGQIVLTEQDVVYDCVVRNLSDTGARLRLKEHIKVPDTFRLKIIGSGQPARRVEARWQLGNDVGVKFLERFQ